MEFTVRRREECVIPLHPLPFISSLIEIGCGVADALFGAVIEMLLAILSICSHEELEDSDSSDEPDAEARTLPDFSSLSAAAAQDLAGRRQQIKNKILVVGKMQRLFQLLRYVSCWRYCHALLCDGECES